MTRRHLWGFALAYVFGTLAWGASENHRASLRGITGVQIRVESLSAEARLDGLTESAIEADVQQRLRAAGVAVLAAAQGAPDGMAPVLYVRVNAKRSHEAPVYAVNVTVALLQDVVAARDPNLRLREAKTWDAGYLRTYEPAGLRQARGVVGDLVAEFIQDWRAANGK